MPWTDEVVSRSTVSVPAKLTLEWEVDGQQFTLTAKVKDPTILAVSEREHYLDYNKVYAVPKEFYLEFDKDIDGKGNVYQIQVTKPFKEKRTIYVPSLSAKIFKQAAAQAGVEEETEWNIEPLDYGYAITPKDKDARD